MRRVQRVFGICALAALVGAAFVTIGSSPAAGAPVGYTLLLEGGGECRLATVDLTSGLTTPLSGGGTTNECVTDLTMSPDGTVYGIQEVEEDEDFFVDLVRFDALGNATSLGHITPFEALIAEGEPLGGGLAFDNQGVLHAFLVVFDTASPCDDGGPAYCLYRVDPANTEGAQFVGAMTTNEFFALLAGSCGGGLDTIADAVTVDAAVPTTVEDEASVTPETEPAPEVTTTSEPEDELDEPAGSSASILSAVNKSTAAVAPIGPTGLLVTGIAFGGDGVLYGIGHDGIAPAYQVLRLDPTTGAATAVAEFSVGETEAVGLALPLVCPVLSFTG
jgi:hypothetical protein